MTEISDHTIRTFTFSFPACTSAAAVSRLAAPVRVPAAGAGAGAARELVQRLRAMFHVPVYLEDELNEKLAQFLAEETKKFRDERDAALLARLRGAGGSGPGGSGPGGSGPGGSGQGAAGGESAASAESAVRAWERRFKDHVFEFAEHKGTSDEEEFAAMYHKLVHSPALESVLRAEAALAAAARAAAAARDDDIRQLTRRQTEEMEAMVRGLGTSSTEAQINALAARQFEEQSLAAARWGSQLDALTHAQRAQHRAALHAALRHTQPPPLSPLSPLPAALPAARQEESFTIHLGSQLKQTHNVRIVAVDVEDLFDPNNPSAESRQLQTALALYSGELGGAVLLRAAAALAPAAARAAADHHFPDLERQLQHIEDATREPIEKRNAARFERSAAEPGGAGPATRPRRRAQTGDVLVTRHSNLPDAHVVFHLVVNDRDADGEMTSRHPAILGLRSVLQCASCNDVTSLALPLLLRHELTEEMTAAWCTRRAELVLKCVKGFMLEAAAGGGARLRTLTLCAPAALAPPVFAALRALPAAVFRQATPLKIKR